jgi:malate dehydrogenase (oxaloacetate-decarboxylating)(NADP+)
VKYTTDLAGRTLEFHAHCTALFRLHRGRNSNNLINTATCLLSPQAECTAHDAYTWTNGAAIVASGSPFDPVTLADGRVKIPSQCNNMYIFPGLGLAASVAGIKRITDKMLYTAAVACADSMTPECVAEGRTFPKIQNIREGTPAIIIWLCFCALSAGEHFKLRMIPTE